MASYFQEQVSLAQMPIVSDARHVCIFQNSNMRDSEKPA